MKAPFRTPTHTRIRFVAVCMALGLSQALARGADAASWTEKAHADPAAVLSLVGTNTADQQPASRGGPSAQASQPPQPAATGTAHSSVPEPATYPSMAMGLALLALARRRIKLRADRRAAATLP